MRKSISIFIFVALVLCFALVPTFLNGLSSKVYLPQEDKGYEITAYDVNIDVKKDGSFDVKETLDVHFYTGDTHGIYRWLPLVQTSTYRNDKGKVVSKNFKAKVSNVFYDKVSSSDYTYIVDRFTENGNYFLQIGSTSFVPAGSDRTYSFSYNYNFGNDRDKSMDMLYYNIIGTGWDTKISNLTFSISMPKDVGAGDFDFYVGRYGESETSSDRVTYNFDEETLTLSGSVSSLAYGEAVTVFKSLEEGYFNYSQSFVFDYVLLVLTVLVLFVAVLLLIVKRKKHPVVEVVEFKAPEGITPTEAGLIIDGKVNGEDLSSLIVYWASKGFVKIHDEDKHAKIVKTATPEQIEKLKPHEKLLFEDMFRGERTEVFSNDLDLRVKTGFECQKSVEKETAHFFDRSAGRWYGFLLLFATIVSALFCAKSILQSVLVGWQMTIQIALTILFVCGLWCIPAIFMYKEKWKKKKFLALLVLDLAFIFAPIITQMVLSEAFIDVFGARFYLSIIPIVMILIYPRLERYSQAGREMLGRVRGLRNYILVAEKDKMEMLVKDNPTLFYEILPYAYVLGVSDVYMKKFEDIEIVQPDWYESNSDSWTVFWIVNICMSDVSTSMRNNIAKGVASQVGKTVGSFTDHIGGGGGGFSGGGHGGGGGGRW